MIHDIDAIGLICPLPVLKLRKVLKSLPAGEQVHILADDPVAVVDIPHFCQTNGHHHVETLDLAQGVKQFVIIAGG
jgi:tRNA 2-thiouridine synthesizing protein A